MAVIGATQLEPVNVLGSYVQGMELGRQARAQRQQEAEALRAAQQERTLNALVESGALTTPEGRNQLMQTPGGLAILEAYGKTQEQMGKGMEAQTKGLSDRLQYWKRMLPANPTQAPAWVASAYQDPIIGPELSKLGTSEQVIASIPADPAQYAQWMEGVSMFADEYAKRRVPTAESLLEYTQPMSPEVFAQQKELRMTGAPRTTINMPAAGAFSKTLGEQAATRLDDLRTKAESANNTLQTSEQLLPLLDDPNFISGTLANARLAVAKAVGIDVSATETYFAGIGQQVAERITAFGAGTGLSDADREFAKKIAGGEETLTVGAIRRIIRINNESARNVIGRYNEERMRLGKKEPEVLDYYPELSITRQVRRTGTVNGRRVVEYSDGSIEYAD